MSSNNPRFKKYKETILIARNGNKHGKRALGLINALRDYELDDYERLERIDEIMQAYNEVCVEPHVGDKTYPWMPPKFLGRVPNE